MASRKSKWGDELEGKFSGRELKRRWRSGQRKRSSRSLEPPDSDERTKKRPGKYLGAKSREEALGENRYDMHPDDLLDEDETYSLNFDEGFDPDSAVDYSPDNWR